MTDTRKLVGVSNSAWNCCVSRAQILESVSPTYINPNTNITFRQYFVILTDFWQIGKSEQLNGVVRSIFCLQQDTINREVLFSHFSGS